MKTNFLEEAPGEKSSTRLKTFLLLLFLFALDILLVTRVGFEVTAYFILLNGVMLDYIFRPQKAHKILENKLYMEELNAKATQEKKEE